MDIIAACAPTLRPGWKWLLDKMKGRSSHKGHTKLTDEVHLRPYRGGIPTNTSTVTGKSTNYPNDLEYGDTSLPSLPQMHKLTQVDVHMGGESQALREFSFLESIAASNIFCARPSSTASCAHISIEFEIETIQCSQIFEGGRGVLRLEEMTMHLGRTGPWLSTNQRVA